MCADFAGHAIVCEWDSHITPLFEENPDAFLSGRSDVQAGLVRVIQPASHTRCFLSFRELI